MLFYVECFFLPSTTPLLRFSHNCSTRSSPSSLAPHFHTNEVYFLLAFSGLFTSLSLKGKIRKKVSFISLEKIYYPHAQGRLSSTYVQAAGFPPPPSGGCISFHSLAYIVRYRVHCCCSVNAKAIRSCIAAQRSIGITAPAVWKPTQFRHVWPRLCVAAPWLTTSRALPLSGTDNRHLFAFSVLLSGGNHKCPC